MFIILTEFIKYRWWTIEAQERKDHCSYWRLNTAFKKCGKCGWFTTNAKHLVVKNRKGWVKPEYHTRVNSKCLFIVS